MIENFCKSSITLIILLIAPLGLAAVIINTILVTIALSMTALREP
ncbi:MAG: CRISPR-associated protein Csx18 [Nostoc sp.]